MRDDARTPMQLRHAVSTTFLVLALTACGTHSDSDQLTAARKRLRPAPCGKTPAVAAVAGVNSDPHDVYLGDWLLVSVCNADQLLASADAAQVPVSLFIEGMDSSNNPVGIDRESGILTFVLDRNDQNRELWKPFLYDPLFDPAVNIHVSVGLRGERPLPRVPSANTIIHVLKMFVDWTTWLWMLFLLVFVVMLFLAARYTDMLRQGPPVDGVRQPYSLGRTQMAWWFFLVVISYTFIWLVLSDRDTIPPSLLGLMGISSATALAAVLLAPAGAAPRATQGFWRDLVTDDKGSIALDRLQIVVWTLVLSGIFLSAVILDLTMPEFNTTLLALMGISSGTYIGFQLPQRNTTT